jgi:type VII secretion-associated serine protease mycosin
MIRRLGAALAATLAACSLSTVGTTAGADAASDGRWYLRYLDVPAAQRISTGKGVTVAVIDSGVANHPDLAGSVLNGTDFVDPGGSGRRDTDGHGTAMAGLIAARGNKSRGAWGIAPDARILPLRVMTGGQSQHDAKLGPAILWAVRHGAKVINISSGGGIAADVPDALEAAVEADVVVVAASGNKPETVGVTAPALFDSVVAVAASDQTGRLDPISATGPQLDLVAPGSHILSTSVNGGYRTGTGTSDAAAIVSGAVALIRSRYPKLSAPEVVRRLENTATDKGAPGVDDQYGHGIINIVAALSPGAGQPPGTAPSVPSAQNPAPTTAAAAPEPVPGGNNGNSTPLTVTGVVLLVLIGAGVAAYLVNRRRQAPG